MSGSDRQAARQDRRARATWRWPGRTAVLASVLLGACGGGGGGGGSPVVPVVPVGPTATQYVNPVLDADFPDPTVIRGNDGTYYGYATQTTGFRIQVARSSDLVTWGARSEALPTKPVWTSTGSNYFAPDVAFRDGRYVMYFAAQADTTAGTYCIGMAQSPSPTGPFVDVGRPLLCGSGRGNGDFTAIDPQGFDDPTTGKRYLYWGSGFAPIRVQELAADRASFAAGSASTPVVAPRAGNDPSAYDVGLVEGPWVTYNAPYYYLYFSGNSCCGAGAHYAVMVARSSSPTGPFEVQTSGGAAAQPILRGGGPWSAPGHNSVVRDAAGVEWMLYHAISSTNPYLIPGNTSISRRPMLLDRITYTNGWPVVGTGGVPTSTPQTRPTAP